MNESARLLIRDFYDGAIVAPLEGAAHPGRMKRWIGTAALAAAMGASMVFPASAMDSVDFSSRVEAAARLDNPDHVRVVFFERAQGETREAAETRLAGELSTRSGVAPASALETAKASLASVETVQGAAAMYIRTEQTLEASEKGGGATCFVLRSSGAPGVLAMETGSRADWAVGPAAAEADRRLTFLHETNHCLDHRYFAALFKSGDVRHTESEAVAMMHGFEAAAESSAVYAGVLMGLPQETIDDRIAARAVRNSVRQLLAPGETGNRDADTVMASAGLIYDVGAGMRSAEVAARERLASGRPVDTASAAGLADILAEGRRFGNEGAHSASEMDVMRHDLSRLREALSPASAGMNDGLGDGRMAGALLSRAMELPVFSECAQATRTFIIEGARGLAHLSGEAVLTERARVIAGLGAAAVFVPERPSDLALMTPGIPLSLPLRADAVSGLWARAAAKMSPKDVARSYQATRAARDAVNGKDEAAAVARDGLELGRRLLGGQLRAHDIARIDVEKADRRPLSSTASSALPDWMRGNARPSSRMAELVR